MSKHGSSVISKMAHRYQNRTLPDSVKRMAIGFGLCASLILYGFGAMMLVSAGSTLFATSTLTTASGLQLGVGLGGLASGHILCSLSRNHIDEVLG